MTLDTPDAELFDQTVSRIAHELRPRRHRTTDVRRARAVGILADPQHALDLMSGRERSADNRRWHRVDEPVRAPHPRRPGQRDRRETGAVSIEKLGAATTALLTDWLARWAATGGKVTLRPVLHLDPDDPASDTTAVDQHDPPTALRELCVLRDAHCVFPGCRIDSRGCDLDHITAYIPMGDGGPPGQTNALNLAPLCRRHHRLKTHTAWDYKRLDDGTYTWTAPTGHQYTVRPASRRPPDRRA